MLSLTIGVPVTDHNNRLYLDDIKYFDLLHRIGLKLRQIGLLDVSQIIIALRLTETNGGIWWHKLHSDGVIRPSTDWGVNTYQIWFGLVEPGHGMNCDVLDLPSLYKLVEDLGVDLRTLWKLERTWVVDMFKRLNALCFVNGLVMEGTVLPGQVLPEIICKQWETYRGEMKVAMGNQYGDMSYALGGRSRRKKPTGEELNQEKNWKPNIEVVRTVIRFAMATGRLDHEN